MTLHRKQSEEEFGAMLREAGFWVKKQQDRRRPSCPNCGRELSPCPYCKQDTLYRKSQNLPDFLVAQRIGYFECKQGHDSWEIEDFTPIQVKALNDAASKGWPAYFFLLMGDGPVLKGGRKAWLVPWAWWVYIQKDLLEAGYKSIRFESSARSKNPTAGEVLKGYELEWNDGHWNIGRHHPFWDQWQSD